MATNIIRLLSDMVGVPLARRQNYLSLWALAPRPQRRRTALLRRAILWLTSKTPSGALYHCTELSFLSTSGQHYRPIDPSHAAPVH